MASVWSDRLAPAGIYRLLQNSQITDEARQRIERELDLEEASLAVRKRHGERNGAALATRKSFAKRTHQVAALATLLAVAPSTGARSARDGKHADLYCRTPLNGWDLDMQLKKHGIHQLIVIGLIAHTCIEATVRSAAELGYDLTVAKEATADYSDEMMHAALDINMPNYATAIVTTREVVAYISSLAARKRAAELEFVLAAANGRHDDAKRPRRELEEIERQIELARPQDART